MKYTVIDWDHAVKGYLPRYTAVKAASVPAAVAGPMTIIATGLTLRDARKLAAQLEVEVTSHV